MNSPSQHDYPDSALSVWRLSPQGANYRTRKDAVMAMVSLIVAPVGVPLFLSFLAVRNGHFTAVGRLITGNSVFSTLKSVVLKILGCAAFIYLLNLRATHEIVLFVIAFLVADLAGRIIGIFDIRNQVRLADRFRIENETSEHNSAFLERHNLRLLDNQGNLMDDNAGVKLRFSRETSGVSYYVVDGLKHSEASIQMGEHARYIRYSGVYRTQADKRINVKA